jgi:hypothetical protein
MPEYFALPQNPRRSSIRAPFCARTTLAVIAALAGLAAAPAGAEENNPLRALTNAIGLTAPTAERPDFVQQSRPDEQKMDFVPFLGPDKKRIPLNTPAQIAADDAALVAEKNRAQARMKKLGAERVDQPAAAPKPPAVTDQF